MHVFMPNGEIQKMDTPEDILYSFYINRTKYHNLRKKYLQDKISLELKILDSKVRYIRAVVNEELILFKRKKIDITEDMKKMNLYENPDYKYLLDIPGIAFTEEKLEQMEKDYKNKQIESDKINKLTIKDLWYEDFKNTKKLN